MLVCRHADWAGPQDIKTAFGARVDFLRHNRAIFDLGGNKYRLVGVVLYRRKAIYIRFVGTHAAYDHIDAKTIWKPDHGKTTMSEIRPIRNARDHRAALAEIDALLAARRLSKARSDRLEVLTVLVSDYEDRVFPTAETDPIDLLGDHMRNSGRTQKDLADMVGRGLASLILSRQRAMSLAVIRKVSDAWGIPADLLIKPYALAARRA